ncbi:fatty acyl-CoA reductase -like, partial [Asbolus verrucosus]
MAESHIRKFYDRQNVFITGGTGFMGKVLTEKLLRSTNVATIYILIRTKKGKDAQTRLKEMLNDVLFEKLQSECSNFKDRVIAIPGDCTLPDLGLEVANQETLITDTNIVFHVAATVRFNENIKLAYDINVKGVENLVNFCKRMKMLKSLVHVSTAFCNCHLDSIEEKFYGYPLHYEKIEAILEEASPTEANNLATLMLRGWPNTYTFTKAWGEALIKDIAGDLPIAIFRPAIVTSTYNEPIESWTCSLGGPANVIANAGLGLIRIFPCDPRLCGEIVPVDMSIAALIAIAWDVTSEQETRTTKIPIYNYVSSVDNPLRSDEFVELNKMQFSRYPLSNCLWVPKFRIMRKSRFYSFLLIAYHYIPAFFLDILMTFCFKKPRMVNIYKKIEDVSELFRFFTEKNWTFSNDNIKRLWNKMDGFDKELFPFDIVAVNWIKYLRNYYKGLRMYIFKDPLETLPKARIRAQRLEILHKVLMFT